MAYRAVENATAIFKNMSINPDMLGKKSWAMEVLKKLNIKGKTQTVANERRSSSFMEFKITTKGRIKFIFVSDNHARHR